MNKGSDKQKYPAGLETGRVKLTCLLHGDLNHHHCFLKFSLDFEGQLQGALNFHVTCDALPHSSHTALTKSKGPCGEVLVPKTTAPGQIAGGFTGWLSKRLFFPGWTDYTFDSYRHCHVLTQVQTRSFVYVKNHLRKLTKYIAQYSTYQIAKDKRIKVSRPVM